MPANEALRANLKLTWPTLDDDDLDLLIEHAERLAEQNREVAV